MNCGCSHSRRRRGTRRSALPPWGHCPGPARMLSVGGQLGSSRRACAGTAAIRVLAARSRLAPESACWCSARRPDASRGL